MLEDFKRYWHNDSDDVQFLLDFSDPESRRRHRFAAAAALSAEIVLISILSLVPAASAPDYSSATRIEASTRLEDARAEALVAHLASAGPPRLEAEGHHATAYSTPTEPRAARVWSGYSPRPCVPSFPR